MNVNLKAYNLTQKSWWKEGLRLIPLLLLVFGLIITFFIHQLVVKSERQTLKESFEIKSNKITQRIEQRLNAYSLVLQGVGGLFSASNSVNRDEFHDYVEILEISKNYPGIQSIGFAQAVSGQEITSHIKSVRKEGFANYHLFPSGKRDSYSLYIYLEPFSNINRIVMGFDAFSEPTRRIAMEKSRDLNQGIITDKVRLVQDTKEEKQASFVMYLPVYKKNMLHNTVSERRAHLLGWVFIQFRMNNLMHGILEDQHNDIDLEIFDGKQAAKETLMYDDDKVLRLHQGNSKQFEFTEIISVLEHSWRINIYALEGFFSKASLSYAESITKTGIILSIMVSALFWLLIKLRQQSERLAQSITVDLQKSESRFKFAIDDSGDGLWDWDLVNKKLFFSNRAKEMLGFDSTEVGNNITAWEQSIHIDDKPDAISKMQACLGSKTSQYLSEYRIHCKDGSMKWILDRGMVLHRDINGKPLRMIGTLTDITGRKKWESDLLESEKRFRIVADAAPVLIWKSGVDKLCYWFNKTWFDFTGRTLEQEQGNGWAEGVHPDDLEFCLDIYTSHFDARKPFYMEYRLRRHDGEYRWLSDSGVPLIDELGVFSGYIGSCSDISDTKQTQLALQKSEHQAQQALAELRHQKYALDQHAIVATTDVHGKITYVNDKFCQISGYSQQELIGQNHRILNSGHHPSEFFINLYQTIVQGKVWNGEICNRAKNGSLYWMLTTIVPFLDGKGKPIQYIAIRTDITERKNADAKLQESLNEKEMLLKEVYHRVKNNLQVVSSLVNLQAATIENKEAIELLKQSADRIKSMALLHEKLYQSKDLAKIDFNDYIRSLIEHLKFGFGSRPDLIKFNINIANIFLDVDTAIPCGLIVNEVVSNSLKHAFPGNREGSVEISLTQELDELTLIISDNGVGFPADWELKNSTSLGLDLVNELSRQLLGKMTLDKEGGSKFTIRFNPSLLVSQAHVFHPTTVVP